MLMMPPPLSIEKVFAEMKAIAHAAGKDSQKSKKELFGCRRTASTWIPWLFSVNVI